MQFRLPKPNININSYYELKLIIYYGIFYKNEIDVNIDRIW